MRSAANRKSRVHKPPKAILPYRPRGASKPSIHNVRFPGDEQYEHVLKAADKAKESLSLFAATACMERANQILGRSVEPPQAVPA